MQRYFRRQALALQLATALGLLGGTALLWAGTPTEGFRNDPDRLVIITVHWRDRAQLQQIAGRFQHLQVDFRARTARTEASASDLAALTHMGVRAEIDDQATDRMRTAEAGMAKRAEIARKHLTRDGRMTAEGLAATQAEAQSGIPGYACYRTVEETYATMDQLAHDHPTLASVVDIGPTWTYARTNGAQGYRMRVLRLNNSATDASIPDKPNMVVISAIHAREYTTAELATRFAEWLANGYGTDSEATWLLDNFRFHFVLQANPDGRKKAESGLSWRKNTDTDNGSCSADAYGVDLNRNFTWRFGTVSGGSSSNACDNTYRGPSAKSEEETQNIMRYVVGTQGSNGVYGGGALPDRRSDTGTSPSDYKGLLLDLHSYSQLVLWPWAYTNSTAPNASALRTLGRRLAYFNNYKPAQWTALYAADGTNTDTIYGLTGAPSYTIEMGKEFFEDCSTFESTTYPLNFAAMKYAARNLQQPYTSPGGPDATSIGVSAPVVARGQALAVAAWFDDSRFNQANGTEPVQNIASASATLDAAPWSSGATPLAMRAHDGAFNSSREEAVVNIDTRGLAYGRHVVYVRGTDASGQAGTPTAIYFTVASATAVSGIWVNADFDGDGRDDLFWRNYQDGRDTIWRSANSAYSLPVTMVNNFDWIVAGIGDFNGDGKGDILWRNRVDGRNSIWLSGKSTTPQPVLALGNMDWVVAGVADFDGDGRSDILWRNMRDGRNTIWKSANSSTSQAVTTANNFQWVIAGIGDFNGDGKADVLWRNSVDGRNSVWLSANSAMPQTLLTLSNMDWVVAGVGDFDGDGKSDILWRNMRDGRNTIWKSANSSTSQAVLTLNNLDWVVADVADFDGDGKSDILWRNVRDGRNSIWRSANSSTMQPVTTMNNLAWVIAG